MDLILRGLIKNFVIFASLQIFEVSFAFFSHYHVNEKCNQQAVNGGRRNRIFIMFSVNSF